MKVAWGKIREWGGVVMFLMITGLFLIWLVFGQATINRQNAAITAEVRTEITQHGQASAARSCASTKLLRFIIQTGNQRAHELHTGSYLRPAQKKRINGFVRAACLFEAP